MSDPWRPPMLGFENGAPFVDVVWKDGTPCGGILACFDPEWQAKRETEEAQREELRNLATNVILLDDWMQR
jgi:hypothetical protein